MCDCVKLCVCILEANKLSSSKGRKMGVSEPWGLLLKFSVSNKFKKIENNNK